MTAPPSLDLSGWLTEQLAEASPDLLRHMISTLVPALMRTEADGSVAPSTAHLPIVLPAAGRPSRPTHGRGRRLAARVALTAARREARQL